MTPLPAATRHRLEAVLAVAQEQGALGPGPVGAHIDHSLALASLAGDSPSTFLDLGSGGGVPGLVLSLVWPAVQGILLEASQRRSRALEEGIRALGLEQRCTVVCGRAEVMGRRPEYRERLDLVVARAFGRPAVTAECGAPFLVVGGSLLVSEGPDEAADTRWPLDSLAALGLGAPAARRAEGASAVLIRKTKPSDDRWPRRTGIPAKRPLW